MIALSSPCCVLRAHANQDSDSNGANLNWGFELLGQPPALHSSSGCDPNGESGWIFASVNAAPYLAASLVGCWLSDPLSEGLLGRRAPIAISAISVVASAVGSAFVQKPDWGLLLLCRIILGIGMGTKAAVVPVFAAEIAPAHLRGSLVMNWQLFDAFGILAGFTANLIAATAGADAWRWEFASAALPAMILLGQIYAAPESPRFLMKQGMRAREKEDTKERDRKFRAAYDIFLALRGEPILAAKELLYAHEQMLKERKLLTLTPSCRDLEHQQGQKPDKFSKRASFFHKLRIVFAKKRTRRALFAAMVVMLAQQLCGINVLMFYSSTVYGDLGDRCGQADIAQPAQHLRPLFLSWGIGLANCLFAFPAYWLIDRRGRRFLLLATLPFMALSILAAGLSYFISDDTGKGPAYVVTIGLFTYVFVALYSVGLGPVPFTYSAECFPLEVRMVGMSFAVFTNLLGAGILALFVPVLTIKLGHEGLLGIFAGLNVVALILVFLFVPETAGAAIANDPANADGSLTAMSLEELNYVFGIRTEVHVEYQCTEVLRDYFIKRYFLRDPDWSRPRKFYMWPSKRKQSRSNTLNSSNEQDNNGTGQAQEEMPSIQRQQSAIVERNGSAEEGAQPVRYTRDQENTRMQTDTSVKESMSRIETITTARPMRSADGHGSEDGE